MHHGSVGTTQRRWPAVIAALIAALLATPVHAQAGDPTVQAGDATFTIDGNTYTIEQLTDRAIIDWQDFSIDFGDLMQFLQPGADSAVLNRVTSGNPSLLLGDLEANGQVYLLNPNGVLIGPDANIRTQTFVASSLDIANSDFMAGGDLTFTGSSAASVINHGEIKAIGGDVFLIAHTLENHGRIKAADGTVGMAAGSEVLLKQAGDRRLFVQAGSGSADTGIDNTGNVLAAHAELAAAGGNVYALAINQSGVVRANGVTHHNGRILLTAEGGSVHNSGKLKAPGGDVRVLGDEVTIGSSARIDVRVDFGDAGQVLIGGDYLGDNPDVYNARDTLVDFGAIIRADGGEHGDGGRVIVWADDRTRFGGSIRARGGHQGGDGGFVEVSGKNQLTYRGAVDVRAPRGQAGTLLLDPNIITIADGAGASPAPGTWDDEGGANVTIYEQDLEAATGNLVLNASDDIIFNDLSDDELTLQADSARFLANNESSLTTAGGIFMRDTGDTLRMTNAGAWIELQGGNISSGDRPRNASMEIGNIVTNGGDVFLTVKRASPATPIYVQNITTAGGAITVDRVDADNSNNVDFTSEGLLDTSGGDIDITLVGGINIDAGINLGTGALTFSGTNTNLNSAITATGNVTIDSVLNFGAGASISTDGSITFTSTANMNMGGTLTLSGSDFDFQDTFAGNGGALTLQPNTVAGNMTIDAATFANIDGFASVTMGRADGTGTATLTGNISITDPFAVIMGGVGGTINQTGNITGNDDSSITYTAGGTIDIDGTIDVPDGITFVAPTVDIAAALDAGAGDFSITTDALAYTASLTGTGAFTIQPLTDSTTMGIGSGAAGSLLLDDTELGNLTPGFASYTFGSASGTGDIDVRDHTFDADLTIRSGGAGGDITLNDALATTAGGITLDAGGFVALASGSSITTQAGAVNITTGSYFDTASGTTITTNDGDFTATIGANSVSPTERAIRSSIATGTGDIAIAATNPSHLRFRGANLSATTGDIDITVGAGGANGSKIELFDGSTFSTQDGAITLTNTDTDGWILLGGAGDGTGVLEATGVGSIALASNSRTYIRNGSRIETAGGSITLDTSGLTVGDVGSGDITATGGAVLIDSDDTVDFGAAGMITAADLGVIANGATTINSTVSNLAVQKTGNGAFTLTNSGALTIADLSGLDASLNVTSIAGDADSSVTASSPITFAVDATSNLGAGNTMTWTSADDGGGAADDNITVNTGVTVSEAAGSLTFNSGDAFVMNGTAAVSAAETLTINAGDGATQAATGTITTDELLLTGSDDFDLQGAANDANTIAASITGALTWVDADGFAIGSVDGTDGLTSTTTITLDAGGAVSQTEAISADELLMLGGVDYVLFNASNDVNTIAAVADDFAFADADGFTIGSINGTDGLTANATITLSAGDTVTQTEAITGTGLALLGGNDYTLTNAGNDIDTLAGDLDDLTFRDADGFTIGSVTGTDGITSAGTVQLTAGAAVTQTEVLTADALLALGGVDYTLFNAGNDVNTIAADADDFAFADADGFTIGSINGADGLTANGLITLTAGDAVTQTEAITATDLLLLGGNDYTLTNAGNDIDTLAAVVDAFSFTDSDTLTIGTVGGTTGLSATDDVTLTAGNNLLLNDAIAINAAGPAVFTARADGNITVASNVALQATGSAVDFTLNADRDSDNDGAIALNDGSSIASAGGDIVLGGGADPVNDAAVGAAGHGIELDNATLTSSGGAIQLTGASSSAGNQEYGVFVDGGSIAAGGGDIDITGANTGAGDARIGVLLNASTLTTTGSGQLDITGTGSDNGTGDAAGIVSDATTLTTADGDITLTGAGGASAGTSNLGIRLTNNADINATGAGNVTLAGVGGGSAGGSENDGVVLENVIITAADGAIALTGADGFSDNVNNSAGLHLDGATVRSAAGNLALTGTASSGDASTGIRLDNATTIGGAADPGSITFTADAMALNATNDVIIRGAGDLLIQPESSATTIGIGDGATGALQLSSQELDAFQDGFNAITIGRANLTGAMHVTDITLLDPATLRTGGALSLTGAVASNDRLTLHTGAITQSAGSITAPDLEVRSTGSVNLEQANDVDTIAIDADGHITLRDTDGLLIGAVGSTAGLTAGGDIVLTAGGDVTQTRAISADDLTLLGLVDYILEHADNDVNTISANAASLSYVDADGLEVGPANGTAGITATGNVTLSTGGDLSIESAIDAATVDLHFGDAGPSTFDATASITGNVSITGGSFDDTVRIAVLAADLSIDGSGGANTLHLDDAGESTGHTYTVAEGMIQRQSTLRTIAFDDIAAVQITAGSGDDTVFSSFIAGLAQELDGGPGVNLLDFDPRPATLASKLSPLTAAGFGDVVHRNFTFAIIPLTFDFDSADGDMFFLSDRTGRNRMAQRSNSGVRDSGYDAQRAALDADLLSDKSAAELAALRRARGRLLYRRAELAYRLGPARRTALVALSSHDLFATDAASRDDDTRIVEVHETHSAD